MRRLRQFNKPERKTPNKQLAAELNLILRTTTYEDDAHYREGVERCLRIIDRENWHILLGCQPEEVDRKLGRPTEQPTVERARLMQPRQLSDEARDRLRENAAKARLARTAKAAPNGASFLENCAVRG